MVENSFFEIMIQIVLKQVFSNVCGQWIGGMQLKTTFFLMKKCQFLIGEKYNNHVMFF